MLNRSQSCYSGFPHKATKVLLYLSLYGVSEEEFAWNYSTDLSVEAQRSRSIITILSAGMFKKIHIKVTNTA